jgi:hypothetical protein
MPHWPKDWQKSWLRWFNWGQIPIVFVRAASGGFVAFAWNYSCVRL